MKEKIINKKSAPFLVLLISGIILVLALVMPYSTAEGSYKEYLENYDDKMYISDIDITYKDTINMSLLEYRKIYNYMADIELAEEEASFYATFITVQIIMTVIVLVSVIIRKPILIMVLNAINLGVYYILAWDFKDRKVIGTGNYKWGIGYYIYYIAIIAIFVGAVMLLIQKKKAKKQNLTTENLE